MDQFLDEFGELSFEEDGPEDAWAEEGSERQAAPLAEEAAGPDNATDAGPGAAQASAAERRRSSCSGAGDLTCAVCLEDIPLADMAIIKGCDHMYCVQCILQWARHREAPFCPQCKAPFEELLTYRTLDGTLSDFPVIESICLLKRAPWFREWAEERERERAALAVPAAARARGGDNNYLDFYEDFDAEEDDVEDYYFSSAAGRARVVFGNRRWGSNGYVASGRAYARPAPSAAASSSSSNAGGGRGKGGSKGAAFKGVADVFGTSPPCKRGGAGAALMGSSPGAGTSGSGGAGPSGSGASGSTPGSGRRAKRNARRAQTAGGLAGDWDEE